MTKNRFILLALLTVAVAACVKKGKSLGSSEWKGLTESEVRSKLDSKLPAKIPAEKRSAFSDKVVNTMRERGVMGEDPVVPDDVSSITDDVQAPAEG